MSTPPRSKTTAVTRDSARDGPGRVIVGGGYKTARDARILAAAQRHDPVPGAPITVTTRQPTRGGAAARRMTMPAAGLVRGRWRRSVGGDRARHAWIERRSAQPAMSTLGRSRTERVRLALISAAAVLTIAVPSVLAASATGINIQLPNGYTIAGTVKTTGAVAIPNA